MTNLQEHFDQQITWEACPFCGSPENVYLGHGAVRHCTKCVMSWGEGEAATLGQAQQGKMSEAVKRDLPLALKKRIKQAVKSLKAISSVSGRAKRLRGISDDEWVEAVEADNA